METQRDEKLWKIAKKRASFKRHTYTYVVVNLFLWGLWLFSHKGQIPEDVKGLPWPAWCTLGWGVGLFFDYVSAYKSYGNQMEEEEYRRLAEKKNKAQT